MNRPLINTALGLSVCALTLVFAGCQSIGPGTVPRDRADYGNAIAESWKRQTLLNIVKMRYADPPLFVDVGQIVSGYTLETSVGATGGHDSDGGIAIFGGGAKFTDRPTVTYVPMTGKQYIKGLLTAVPPEAVFFLIESGYAADGVLLGMVSSINGLRNEGASLGGISAPTPEFFRVLELMRKIQLAGAMGMRVEAKDERHSTTMLTIKHEADAPAEVVEAAKELRRLLRLDPGATGIELVFAPTASSTGEIAVITRSLIQLLQVLALQVDVPIEHVAQGRAFPGWESAADMPESGRMIRVRSGKAKPKDAFASISYRGLWFWIEDGDLKSKRTLNLIMVMSSLASEGQRESLPLITIPAQ